MDWVEKGQAKMAIKEAKEIIEEINQKDDYQDLNSELFKIKSRLHRLEIIFEDRQSD